MTKKESSVVDAMNSSPWLSIGESLSMVNVQFRLEALKDIPCTDIKHVIKDSKKIDACIRELETVLRTFKDLAERRDLIEENC